MTIDTPVTICFVIPQHQNQKKIKQKSFKQKHCGDDINVVAGQQCAQTVNRSAHCWPVNSRYLL